MDHIQLKQAFQTILQEFHDQVPLRKGQVLVIGCSTSEVMGKRSGPQGPLIRLN